MNIHIRHVTVSVTRSPTDKPVRGGSWGTAESAFWTRLRDELNAEPRTGPRWRRVNPQRYGALTGSRYALMQGRERLIHDVGEYAVRDPAEDFNRGLVVKLGLVPLDVVS